MIVINKIGDGGIADSSFPIGAIILWYGVKNDIPSGYILCNGINTPDLRNKFIKGAFSSEDLLTTSGSTTHLHSSGGVSSSGGHSHHTGAFNSSSEAYYNTAVTGTGATAANYGHTHSTSGVSTSQGGVHSHVQSGVSSISLSMPPYKSLYFIKRIA